MKMTRVPERFRDIQTCYFWPLRTEPDPELRALIRADQMLLVVSPEGCPRLVQDFR